MRQIGSLSELASIIEELQDPRLRKRYLSRHGRGVVLPGGCVGEIQDDGAIVCIACQIESLNPIEWLNTAP